MARDSNLKSKTYLAIALALFGLAGWVLWRGILSNRIGPRPVVPENLDYEDPWISNLIINSIKAVNNQRGNLDIREDLCMAYQANGYFETARDCYLQVLELDHTRAKDWFLLGRSYERTGDLDAAIKALEEAARLVADQPSVHWQLALWNLDAGRLTAADASIEAARRIEPDHDAVRIAEARLGIAQGDYARAISTLETPDLQKGSNGRYARYLLATAYRNLSQTEKAERLSAGLQPQPPRFPDPWQTEVDRLATGFRHTVRVALALMQAQRFSEALEVLGRIAEHRPDDHRIEVMLSQCYLELGEPLKSLEILQRAVERQPAIAILHVNLAVAAMAAREHGPAQLSLALEHSRIAADLDPTDARTHLTLARANLALNSYLEAIDAFSASWQLDSRDPRPLVQAAGVLLQRDQLDAAEQLLDLTLQNHRNRASVHLGLAHLRQAQGEVQQAESFLREAESAPIQDAGDLAATGQTLANKE